ncbi:MAG TPA: S8 family serine peptidase [Thermoanaerobaculia bacterium]|jgi:serine protease AprX|nr:S8 family serine peptidase [Thermoanaerobaculia bacterium]
MFSKINRFALVALVLSLSALSLEAAVVDPLLQSKLGSVSGELLPAVVTYNTQPTATDLAALRLLGVRYGVALRQLPMVGVWATANQIRQIATGSRVRSIYFNKQLSYFNREGTALIGASEQRTMPGFGYSGRGIGVAIVDSGIDATHPDLPFGTHVKQNVKVLIGGAGLGSPFDGVVPPTYLENLPNSDTTSGHGTHASGSIAGLGTESGGKYAGVAPGADLIGVSTGEAIAILWALEGFDYVLTHQYTYNIRVVSNSWGTSGPFDPEDPVSVASKVLHDRGITVVFAAGNEGSGNNTLNPYADAPWVIGVAAADKQGRLASFSSRGIPGDPIYHPTITAAGVAIVSTKANATPLGQAGQCTGLTVAETPWYACMDGTSMATPQVAGACALLLEANPTLTPDAIKSAIVATATPMAGYGQHQVGAGFLNVLAGLDAVKNPSKVYGAVLNQHYNASFTGTSSNESWDQNFDPSAGPAVHHYAIGSNGVESDVMLTWDNSANTFNLAVTDPSGTQTSTGSNALAAVYGLQASLGFAAPAAGDWFTSIYGLKGQSTGTVGVGVPDTLHLSVTNYYGTFSGIDDANGSPYASFIRKAITLRLMDSTTSGFLPDANVTRGEMAVVLASDCWIRQSQLNLLPFTDVPESLVPYVQAVTTAGGPMRDTFMLGGTVMSGSSSVPGGVLDPTPNAITDSGSSFLPNGNVTRADLATWLVRALGKDADAQAAMVTATTFSDDSDIPAQARGYIVVANSLGLMTGYANPSQIEGAPVTYSWQPSTLVTRGALALTMDKWWDIFMTP